MFWSPTRLCRKHQWANVLTNIDRRLLHLGYPLLVLCVETLSLQSVLPLPGVLLHFAVVEDILDLDDHDDRKVAEDVQSNESYERLAEQI